MSFVLWQPAYAFFTELLNEMGTHLGLRWLDMSDVEVLWCCLQTRVILAKSKDVIMLHGGTAGECDVVCHIFMLSGLCRL